MEVIDDAFAYSAAGTLFWREDRDGSIWVLLARRRVPMMLGPVYSFSIPLAVIRNGESPEEAAVRAAHDELGLMADTSVIEPFWNASAGRLSVSLFSRKVQSQLFPKCRGSYGDGSWFCLPEDGNIEDADQLTREELRSFWKKVRKQNAS